MQTLFMMMRQRQSVEKTRLNASISSKWIKDECPPSQSGAGER